MKKNNLKDIKVPLLLSLAVILLISFFSAFLIYENVFWGEEFRFNPAVSPEAPSNNSYPDPESLVKVYRNGKLYNRNDEVLLTVENGYDSPIYLVGHIQLYSFNNVDNWERTSCSIKIDEAVNLDAGAQKSFIFPLKECSLDEARYEYRIGVGAQYSFALEQSVAVEAYSDLFVKDKYTYSDDVGWLRDDNFPCRGLGTADKCDQIDWPMIDSAHDCHFALKDMCYSCFTEFKKDASACDKLGLVDFKEYCYIRVAAQLAQEGRKSEITFCGKIREATQYNMRQECLNYAK